MWTKRRSVHRPAQTLGSGHGKMRQRKRVWELWGLWEHTADLAFSLSPQEHVLPPSLLGTLAFPQQSRDPD